MSKARSRRDASELNPPSARRVLLRAYVLASLACRGAIEQDAGNPKAEAFRGEFFDWLGEVGASTEAESAELAILSKPLGQLSREEHFTATWQAEGLIVLAWALGCAELPDYEQYAKANAAGGSIGWFTPDAGGLLQKAQLRPTAELGLLADKLFALDWRMADFELNRKALDFESEAQTAWFGPLNVDGLRFAKRDLSIGGKPISECEDQTRQLCRLITMNRRRAAEWLCGQSEIYSEVDLST